MTKCMGDFLPRKQFSATPAPMQELSRSPTQCHPIRTKDKRCFIHPGNSRVFRSSVMGTWIKNKMLKQKFSKSSYHLGNYKLYLSGTRGRYFFSLFHTAHLTLLLWEVLFTDFSQSGILQLVPKDEGQNLLSPASWFHDSYDYPFHHFFIF